MRSLKELVTDLVKKPPMLFPLVGLFHILWLLWTFWTCHDEPFPDLIWLELAWAIGYTAFWLAACDMRKWGAIGYILLTLLNVSLYMAVRNGQISRDYLSNMFLLDGLFSVFLLYYFKRFR
jgi:hypothetical protein